MWNLEPKNEYGKWTMVRGESNNEKKEVFFWIETKRMDVCAITSPVFFKQDNDKDIIEYWLSDKNCKRTASVFNDNIGWKPFIVNNVEGRKNTFFYDITFNANKNSLVIENLSNLPDTAKQYHLKCLSQESNKSIVAVRFSHKKGVTNYFFATLYTSVLT